jgi:hypothetical protein
LTQKEAEKKTEKKTLKGAVVVATAIKPEEGKNMIDEIVILHEAYQFLLKKYVCRSKKSRGEGDTNGDEEEEEEETEEGTSHS